MDSANTFIEGALVHSDDDAEMRKQVVDLIRHLVRQELQLIIQDFSGYVTKDIAMSNAMNNLQANFLIRSEYEIKKMALKAVKELMQNQAL